MLVGLLGPRHEFIELVSQGSLSDKNMGSGAKSCHGTMTGFDDGSATSISSGTAPYDDVFHPDEGLDGEFVGDSAKYTWKLIVFDLNQDDDGTLHCWRLSLDF